MKTITVAELRQNPTATLAEVEAGETYVVTRHRHEIARLVPPGESAEIIPAKRTGPSQLRKRPRQQLRTASSIDELLADMASPW